MDVDILVEGLKFTRKIFTADALKDVVKEEIIPGPALKSDVELEEFVRSTGQTVYHPVGTAAMLPRKDGGVVNPELKVYGTKNLRVVRSLVSGQFCISSVCFFARSTLLSSRCTSPHTLTPRFMLLQRRFANHELCIGIALTIS